MNKLIRELQQFIPYNRQEAADRDVMVDFALKNPDCLNRENKIAHFATSRWVVNKEGTKVLMIYHNIYKSWSWAGGHADGESDLMAVAVREIEEETGVTGLVPLRDGIFSVHILTVENHVKKGRFVNSHLHLDVDYLFQADDSLPLRIKEDENSAVGWVDIDKIDSLVNEEKMKPVYRLLCEKMKYYIGQ